MGCVYGIWNENTGKIYIGSAVNFENRKRLHIKTLRKGTHHNKYLQRAWEKYGEDNFEFVIIEEIFDKNQLLEREQYFMDYYDSYNSLFGYNIDTMAGSPVGRSISEQTREKMRTSRKGIIFSNETKEKISKANKGKIFSEEHKQNISKAKTIEGKSTTPRLKAGA